MPPSIEVAAVQHTLTSSNAARVKVCVAQWQHRSERPPLGDRHEICTVCMLVCTLHLENSRNSLACELLALSRKRETATVGEGCGAMRALSVAMLHSLIVLLPHATYADARNACRERVLDNKSTMLF